MPSSFKKVADVVFSLGHNLERFLDDLLLLSLILEAKLNHTCKDTYKTK